MAVGMFQLVITVWFGAYPFTYTLPKVYTLDACIKLAEKLGSRISSDAPRMKPECVQSDKQEA